MGKIHIMISPAKKMNCLDEYPVEPGRPVFLDRTRRLMEYMRGLDRETIQGIWRCNDRITDVNIQRLKDMDLERHVTPAVLAYEGIQYQSMAPGVFEEKHLDYIGSHLYILSGFYGILRAFDGVVPYRLEMQARIGMEHEGKIVTSLYDYWGSRLYEVLTREADTVINLASEEYKKAVMPWASENGRGTGPRGGDPLGRPACRIVDCVFGEAEEKNGIPRVRVKATAAKMARGSMVRYMAEHQVEDTEQLKGFEQMGYEYREDLSETDRLVFVKPGAAMEQKQKLL